MKKALSVALISLAIVSTTIAPCQAHSLHPVFFRVGPLAPCIAGSSVLGCTALLAIIAVQTFILHCAISGRCFLGNFWRAGVIFLGSRIAEIVPIFIEPDVLMAGRSDAILILIVILMFGAGAGAGMLLIKGLYRHPRPGGWRILGLSLKIEFVSCFGLSLCNTVLLWARIII